MVNLASLHRFHLISHMGLTNSHREADQADLSRIHHRVEQQGVTHVIEEQSQPSDFLNMAQINKRMVYFQVLGPERLPMLI